MEREGEKCVASCRDGTACLNKAKYERYCWVHCETAENIFQNMLNSG